MKKITGGALALLAALAMSFSGTSAQAQGFMDTLKNIAANGAGNYLGSNYGGPGPYQDPYGYNGYGQGYYPQNNSGILGSVGNLVRNRLNGNVAGYDPYLYNTANGYGGNAIYDPSLYASLTGGNACQNGANLNNVNWNNGNLAGWNNGANAGWNGNNLAAGGCNGGGHHKHKHHRYNSGGPQNGFYSYQNGVPLGGVGYNPLLVGR